MEWISVNDRFPKNYIANMSMSILLYDGEYVDVGHYCFNENKFINYGEYLQYNNVTHWMPLPEPPKEY